MALKNFNPVTASLRGTVLIDRRELWKGKPVKGLTVGKPSTGGRNQHGHITSRFRGGGHKQSYRIVDFRRRKFDVPATVEIDQRMLEEFGEISVDWIGRHCEERKARLGNLLPQRAKTAGDCFPAGQAHGSQ